MIVLRLWSLFEVKDKKCVAKLRVHQDQWLIYDSVEVMELSDAMTRMYCNKFWNGILYCSSISSFHNLGCNKLIVYCNMLFHWNLTGLWILKLLSYKTLLTNEVKGHRFRINTNEKLLSWNSRWINVFNERRFVQCNIDVLGEEQQMATWIS